ncbi:MAG: hypothetical protein KKB31_06350 [Nanoarchaeota archaeon]|nr:hypothetical protein [Nanoarchaeota archaeon]
MGVIDSIIEIITGMHDGIMSSVPPWAQLGITFFILIILIVIYSVIVWKFYRFIARKNILELNLNQYNRSDHPVLQKLLAGFFYFIEYIIILPFLIFLWFAVFAILLILLTDSLDVQGVILLSATIIGAIRMISYIPKYGQALAKEVAKLLPFTLLAISMTKPNFFNFSRIMDQIGQLPEFFSSIAIYILFIIFLEIILRLFEFFTAVFGWHNIPDET